MRYGTIAFLLCRCIFYDTDARDQFHGLVSRACYHHTILNNVDNTLHSLSEPGIHSNSRSVYTFSGMPPSFRYQHTITSSYIDLTCARYGKCFFKLLFALLYCLLRKIPHVLIRRSARYYPGDWNRYLGCIGMSRNGRQIQVARRIRR